MHAKDFVIFFQINSFIKTQMLFVAINGVALNCSNELGGGSGGWAHAITITQCRLIL